MLWLQFFLFNPHQTFVLLKDHRTKHTGEKPYSCEHCPSSFGARSSYYTHLRKVHGSWDRFTYTIEFPALKRFQSTLFWILFILFRHFTVSSEQREIGSRINVGLQNGKVPAADSPAMNRAATIHSIFVEKFSCPYLKRKLLVNKKKTFCNEHRSRHFHIHTLKFSWDNACCC